MILHLGVEDIAYSDKDSKGAVTTGEVADILEGKYHVMEVFYQLYEKEIADNISATFAEAIESILQGNTNLNIEKLPFDKIEHSFRDYLDAREWTGVSAQVIMAAKEGVTHRKKGKKRGSERPEFIDTGLYQQSMRVWVTK